MVYLVVFFSVFSFYTGLTAVQALTGQKVLDQTIVSVGSPAGINDPPILLLPQGASLINSTYSTAVNGPLTVYMWWFQFQNSTAHPTNIWEFVYQYWQPGVVPLSYNLYAVATRFHFSDRLIYGGWTLNGTRIFVSFSSTFFIPTVKGGPISNLLRPTNATVLSSYSPILDPSSPYSSGPNAYAPGAGPPDPWVVLNSPETLVSGLIFGNLAGLPAGFGFYGLILVTVHPRRDAHLRTVGRALGIRTREVPHVLLALFDED
jgi:hypothetical protein